MILFNIFFLLQVAIGIQWLVTNPPAVDTVTFETMVPRQHRHRLLVTADDVQESVNVPLCRTSYVDILFSLIYVVFLILFVAVLAFKSRSIRDNYREATYIGLSVGCSIPTWIVWVLLPSFAQPFIFVLFIYFGSGLLLLPLSGQQVALVSQRP